jgi:hypothetical protein
MSTQAACCFPNGDGPGDGPQLTFQVAQLCLPTELAADKLALALILVSELARQGIGGSITVHVADGQIKKIEEHRVHR